MKQQYIILFGLSLMSLLACNKAREIQANSTQSQMETITPEHNHQTDLQNTDQEKGHTITVIEVLVTQKYCYVRAEESGTESWVVVPKTDIIVGQSYYYEGGLMKKNYESLELNKNFETIYLVSHLKAAPTSKGESSLDKAFAQMKNVEKLNTSPSEDSKVEGITSLTDLLSNTEKYKGKVVKVQGKCVKVNNEIMGKNWIHVQDGESSNGKLNDLTITTSENIMMGMDIVIEGRIELDKDFGAGYWYDIIMEGGVKK